MIKKIIHFFIRKNKGCKGGFAIDKPKIGGVTLIR